MHHTCSALQANGESDSTGMFNKNNIEIPNKRSEEESTMTRSPLAQSSSTPPVVRSVGRSPSADQSGRRQFSFAHCEEISVHGACLRHRSSPAARRTPRERIVRHGQDRVVLGSRGQQNGPTRSQRYPQIEIVFKKRRCFCGSWGGVNGRPFFAVSLIPLGANVAFSVGDVVRTGCEHEHGSIGRKFA